MHIRPLTDADATDYRALMLRAYTTAADAFTSTADERAAEPLSYWVRRIADPQGLGVALGAFDRGALVGTVALEFNAKPKTRHKALLIGMFVDDACRGRGGGRALMDAALACARARDGLTLVTLTVTQGNGAAIGLYQRCGFQPFGVEPMAILTPEGYRSKVHMALVLSASAAA
ncbi:GNAT family N-acetyltransferase [Ideonella sp. A 288]|uniref:GNAT family N-acetyltransferase n=1 Tax=Ideonella sp. A 288 TaxID=1962181 RepID=UPI000B4BCEF7|nr:GNAT family N-acetyltransferase [Ideonella sp. A 288]